MCVSVSVCVCMCERACVSEGERERDVMFFSYYFVTDEGLDSDYVSTKLNLIK